MFQKSIGPYQLGRNLGNGTFGSVYKATYMRPTSNSTSIPEEVAIKIVINEKSEKHLRKEIKFYSILVDNDRIPGFASVHSWKASKYIALSLLGPNLLNYTKPINRLTLKTVLMFIDQSLLRLEYLHRKGIVHCDIKPANFCVGLGSNSNSIFLIDFGLSQKVKEKHMTLSSISSSKSSASCFVNSQTNSKIVDFNKKIEKEEKKNYCYDTNNINSQQNNNSSSNSNLSTKFCGTMIFASLAAHQGKKYLWYKDDLESLFYTILYFLNGHLLWSDIKTENKERRREAIYAIKTSTPPQDMCQNLPHVFLDFFLMIKNLRENEMPDYSRMRKMFRDLFISEGFVFDYRYDWIASKNASFNFPSSNSTSSSNGKEIKIYGNSNLSIKNNSNIKLGFLAKARKDSLIIIPRTKSDNPPVIQHASMKRDFKLTSTPRMKPNSVVSFAKKMDDI